MAWRLILTGQVQGVGFRPFVYRLAISLGVRGWVKNVTGAVEIWAEASAETLQTLARRLIDDAPEIARPYLAKQTEAPDTGEAGFAILASEHGSPDIHIPPDYFTCAACSSELNDPQNRRYRYPFINCTQCGPRYTLITALPYDRANTSMRSFALCPACAAEYANPLDRRFHAEPLACPECGPQWVFEAGFIGYGRGEVSPLDAAVSLLREGGILAMKGVGGYHLMCDARNEAAVNQLRSRKHRPGKPLAVMYPDMGSLEKEVLLTESLRQALRSPARPIVLCPRKTEAHKTNAGELEGIAPGLREIGVFLPYAPQHELLLQAFGGPLVATSGNRSGEPVLIDNVAAREALRDIADAFLHHDRPIVRPADDSVIRPIAGVLRPLRLGRGLTPLELTLPKALPHPVLALGSHMKNTVCLAWGQRAVISPHIGELGSPRSQDTLIQVAEDLQRLYQVRAERLLVDAHPGYGYQRWAQSVGLPLEKIHHHVAHASALVGEFNVDNANPAEWLVFTWDGVGLGPDGHLWGGESWLGRPGAWQRRATFRPFHLPGGEKAGREPWRSAAALMWETGQAATFAPETVYLAWQKRLNCPPTHAVGRLFDAAATLLGVCHSASYEGEGPMRLEAMAQSVAASLDWRAERQSPCPMQAGELDWAPLLDGLLQQGESASVRAWRFHAALAATVVAVAQSLRATSGISRVGLTGGVFQNGLLAELASAGLQEAGFAVFIPHQVPLNDAGLSFGQVVEYGYRLS